MKELNMKQVLALLIAAALIASSVCYIAWSPDLTYVTTLAEGSMNIDAAFLIFRDASTYYARNGESGAIDHENTNASYVIHEAFDDLTASRDWKEKVIFKGDFTLTTTILIPSYTVLEVNGRVTVANNMDHSLYENLNGTDGDTEIQIVGGIHDGNSAGQTGGHCVEFYNVTEVVVRDMRITDFKEYGIYMNGTDTSKLLGAVIVNNHIDLCGTDGIYVYRAEYNQVVIEDNYVWDCTQRGIQVSTSYRYIVRGNTVGLQNHQNGLDGISINGAGAGPEAVIADNTCNFNGRHGIYAIHTLGLTITGNTIMGNDYHGIFIEGIYSMLCVITGNYLADNSVETQNTWDNIHIDTENNTITGNTLRNINPVYHTRHGIYITNNNNVVSSNVITGMDTDGIAIVNGNNTIVIGNRIADCDTGVSEAGTADGTILLGNCLWNNTLAEDVNSANSIDEHNQK